MDDLMDRTDVLVHKQLQDLLFAQRQAFETWRESSILEHEHMVSKDQHDNVIKELEAEKLAHAETHTKLTEVSDKLQFALGEIEILSKQLRKEKVAFDASFVKIKDRVHKESSKGMELQSRYKVISEEKSKQDDLLHFKDSKIRDLKQRLAKQKETHQKNMSELSIQMQQEAYIAKVITGKERKKGTSSKT